MKRVVGLVLVLGMICTGVQARELRTPQPNRRPVGFVHPPVKPWDEEYFNKWYFEVWGAAYAQGAHEAYGPCHGTDKVPLSQLFFGKSDFRGKEFFADGVVSNGADKSALWLSFALLHPRVEYDEKGTIIGCNATYQFSHRATELRAGIRAKLPFRNIEMHRDDCCDLGEETLSDVSRRRQSDLFPVVSGLSTSQTTINNDWAYRLDLVSALCYSSCTKKMVTYGTGSTPTTIFDRNVTENGSLLPETTAGLTQRNPVHLTQVTVGSTPSGLLGADRIAVAATPFLDGAGTGPGAGNRTRFKDNTDYTGLSSNIDAQSKFWLVPTLVVSGNAPQANLVMTDDATAIKNAIEDLLNSFDSSTIPFFDRNGISFDTQKTKGLGDLETDAFFGYYLRDNLYGEVVFGMKWPTGNRICDPRLLYTLPRGNNGHIELNIQKSGWWQPKDWFVLKGDLGFHGALSRTERIAASFSGATVKNIGPVVDASVNWHYITMHVDTTFIHPHNQGLGFTAGYELYWKSCDRICFLNSSECDGICEDSGVKATATNGVTAPDLMGVTKNLDASVLAKDTDRLSHKAYLELFHHWNYGDLFLGWSHVFAGKNVMTETAWNIGMAITY